MTQKAQVNAPADKTLPTPRDRATGDAPSTAAARPSGNLTEAQRSVAMVWLRRGLPVIPCSRVDKGPMVAGFGRDATAEELAPFSDPRQVWDWWSGRFRRAHVGILTGRGAGRGLLVIDLDVRKEGTDLPPEYAYAYSGVDILERMATEAGEPWPDTYSVITPSGGVHLYFRQPEEGPLIGCATGAGPTAPHLGPLIDVRGVGGLVIAAGSYSAAQGIAYRRMSDSGDRPQPLPGWLLERLRPAAAPAAPAPRPAALRAVPCGATRGDRYAAAALMGAATDVADAPEGERNRKLFAAARRLGELCESAPAVLSESTVSDALLDAATRAGVSEREALRTIRSGWERGLAGHGAGAA
ncbi:bifunctional DNA primase/polymerase [Streptomyces viridosporus ATCC 14672]|uniref:Bifunctional DNA primase/polymerase n=2 Tax=Streptomyces viridosporus TaxID=67581 RepID=D6AAT7_STRV1|nr:bifunctional DNA primase/polymerase [Streptomyces viridosporus ATCC 14672]